MDTTLFQEWLGKLEAFLVAEVHSKAHVIDQDPEALKTVFEKFKSFNVLALHIPKEFGGLGLSKEQFIDYTILLARHSGALLFLQAQHQYVIRRLLPHSHEPHIQKILSDVVAHNISFGVFLRTSKSLLSVFSVGNDFHISGTIPWMTGYEFHNRAVIGFVDEDKKYIAHVPLENISSNGGEISISPSKNSSVFNAVNTIELSLSRWEIRKLDIMFSEDRLDVSQRIEHPAIYNFAGIIYALIDQIKQADKSEFPIIADHLVNVESEFKNYLSTLKSDFDNPEIVRSQGLKLAKQVLQIAQLSWGGVGLLSGHPVERLSRELNQYAIAGLSFKQIQSYLEQVI